MKDSPEFIYTFLALISIGCIPVPINPLIKNLELEYILENSKARGVPQDAGQCIPLIDYYKHTKKILAICLGHQAIGVAFGAQLMNTSQVYHGVSTHITVHTHEKIYTGLPRTIEVARYHSWIVKKNGLPEDLIVTSTDDSDVIMSLRHNQYDITGLQYHPESFLTSEGKKIIKNWLEQ